ncbi:L-threonylcarbamoyladenylate synthase [Frankia sp. Cppng1_Ct_nod]|uniref:L-threonylcarbamoyladenylate synthase n=1 Tax=Frankia sp. Cppng1_Ct_nod TaxID=2897162 RepID=UPI0010415926|nr:L-threonylcarbamoyladenylate synthase [Frankia sp. Cppng1_Ct_nod]
MSERYDCADAERRPAGLDAATRTVRHGGLVVLPTDTLYGIGADAFDQVAVRSLLAAKGRGRDMPVPVLVGSWRTLDGLVERVTGDVRDLVRAFWPGGLTLVVRHAPSLSWDLGDARGTVAVRMPLHPVAIELLGRTGPMAVSSANISGQPPATSVDDAIAQLGGSVDVYLDGGPCSAGVASTIIDCTGDVPRVLRAGAVDVAALREVLPSVQVPVTTR